MAIGLAFWPGSWWWVGGELLRFASTNKLAFDENNAVHLVRRISTRPIFPDNLDLESGMLQVNDQHFLRNAVSESVLGYSVWNR